MIRGILERTLRDTWAGTLMYGVAVGVAMFLLTVVLPHVTQGIDEILEQIPLVKKLISAMLGVDVQTRLSTATMQATLWVHPVVLALIWAHEIGFCTRLPAGEIDRGTIDVLLSLPVSRRLLYAIETLGWLGSGSVVLLLGWLGHLLARSGLPPSQQFSAGRAALVMANLMLVYVAVGAATLLVSSLSSRRSRAVAVMFALVLSSFLIQFVAQFWAPAQSIKFLGILDYYRPAEILSTGRIAWRDVAVLGSASMLAWILGGEVFARRSICTN